MMYRVHWTKDHWRFMSSPKSYDEAVKFAEKMEADPECSNVEIRLV